MATSKILIVCVQIILLAAVVQAICPKCLCTISYRPLCAVQEKTGRYRGFNSECVLNCSNNCFRNKYKFLGNGRCGAVRKRIEEQEKARRTTTTTTTTTMPTTSMKYDNTMSMGDSPMKNSTPMTAKIVTKGPAPAIFNANKIPN